MNESDPGKRRNSANDEESGVKRYASKDVRSPRRPPLVNLTILIVGIGLILLAIYELFFTRPILFSDERTLTASIEEVETLFDVPGRVEQTFLVTDSAGATMLVPIVDALRDPATISESGIIAFANGTATFRVDIDRLTSGLTIEDDLATVPVLSAGVTRFEIDAVRLVERGQPGAVVGGAETEPSSDVRRAAVDRLLTLARRDSTGLRRAEERAKTVIGLLVRERGMNVEYRSNDQENSN